MAEDDIALIMRQPWTMTCTDGGLQPMTEGKPHPRAYGAFPRKLERYVRERGVVDLPFAIRSMTALPAEVFGLKDRGVVRAGAFADLLVFDLAQVEGDSDLRKPAPDRRGLRHDRRQRPRSCAIAASAGRVPGRVLGLERLAVAT